VDAPFDLAEAIEDVATLVSTRVSEKNLELIVRVSPDFPQSLLGDVGRVRQIVTNLIGNAVKFTEQGHILVNLELVEISEGDDKVASIKISVEDTGIGIPEEKLDSIFDKFSQVDTSATRKFEGTGLGLSIASSLVKLMSGKIGVTSNDGEGSIFWLELDLPVHEIELKAKSAPVDVTGSRILVIDDNEVNRSIFIEQLNSWKFDSLAVESGFVAVDFLREATSRQVQIDCIILDYQMPDMNGEEFYAWLKSEPAFAAIPVIMLTSVDHQSNGGSLMSLGIAGHLVKPARSSMLLETIISVLQPKYSNISDLAPKVDQSMDAKNVPAISQKTTSEQSPEFGKFKAGRNNAIVGSDFDILIAEDNEVNQIVISQILDLTTYTYKIVDNGKTAVDILRAHNPKLILMDVSMPVMNGLDATTKIREFEADSGKHIPIIGVTAHALNGDMEKCFDAGMDDYLSKPVSPKKLQATVEKWLSPDAMKRAS